MVTFGDRYRTCRRCVGSDDSDGRRGLPACPVDGGDLAAHCRENRCPRGLFTTSNWTRDTDVASIRAGLFKECVPYQSEWTQWPNVQEAFRRELAERRPPEMRACGGCGIVVAGGGPYFASVYVAVRMLRHVRCRLPIEVWFLGDRAEMLPWQAGLLQPFGVTCMDADAIARDRGVTIPGGWELKPFAVMESRFAQVCFLDADCYAACNPSHLFDSVEYRSVGALYWPDRPAYSLAPQVWETVGLPDRDEPDFETGAFLVDKRRAWPALALTHWMCQQSRFYFNIGPRDVIGVSPGRCAQGIFGDKSLFHLAHRLANVRYALAPRSYDWISPGIVHFDLDSQTPLFVHRARRKFSLSPDLFHTSPQEGPQYEPRLPMEDEAHGFFAELKAELPKPDHATVFSAIYARELWKRGSEPELTAAATREYRRVLAEVLRQLQVKSVIDLGCGDWQTARFMDWTGIDYLGLDVVPAVIESDRRRFARPGVRFEVADLTTCDPPAADLLICKDLLQHWTDAEVAAFLDRLRGRSMLLTNSICGSQIEIETGGFRPLDLSEPRWGLADAQVIATYHAPSGDTRQILLTGAKCRVSVPMQDAVHCNARKRRPTAAPSR